MALISENLVGYWPLDRMRLTAPQTMLDVSGNSLNGTSANVPTFSNDHRGNPNRAMSCNGTDDYVDVGATEQTIKSISLWINPDDITSRSIIDLDGGTHSVELDGSGNVTATGWASPTIYVDGSSSSALVIQDIWNHIIVTTATGISVSNFDIGREANYFDGDIAHVRLYTRELTATEAYELYSYEKPPKYSVAIAGCVGHWFLRNDRASGVSIYDESNQGNTGTSANTPVYTTGHDGSANGAMVFNGTTDNADCGNGSSLNIVGAISISAWIKTSVNDKEIVAKSISSGDDGYEFDIRNNQLRFILVTNGVNYKGYRGNTVITDNVWHHVAGVWNNTNMYLYVDGQSESLTNLSAGTLVDFLTTADLMIGSRANNNSYFQGSLQNVRIYNTALSIAQINQIYKEYS